MQRILVRVPRLPVAVKAAVAASLAWLAVLPLPGIADDYPYYAPFGAVIAVTSTIVGSLRVSVQAIVAILTGAVVAFGVDLLPLPSVIGLALVVALGMVLAGALRLGDSEEWVPVSAVFVLILGNTDPTGFAMAYLGLTALGAVIGLLVNTLVPAAPVLSGWATTRLSHALAGQLADLAEGLRGERLPSAEEWHARQWEISPPADELRRMLGELRISRRGNWRDRWWGQRSHQDLRRGRALERLSILVQDLALTITRTEHADQDVLVLGNGSRARLIQVLELLSRLLDLEEETPEFTQVHEEVAAGIDRLADEIVAEHRGDTAGAFPAGAIVTALRQVLSGWAPDGSDLALDH